MLCWADWSVDWENDLSCVDNTLHTYGSDSLKCQNSHHISGWMWYSLLLKQPSHHLFAAKLTIPSYFSTPQWFHGSYEACPYLAWEVLCLEFLVDLGFRSHHFEALTLSLEYYQKCFEKDINCHLNRAFPSMTHLHPIKHFGLLTFSQLSCFSSWDLFHYQHKAWNLARFWSRQTAPYKTHS